MGKWVVLLSMVVASPAFAGQRLDVRDWLSRPGVKLLAVEFYATWCVPCKKAVPRWKRLHERYRDQGLRLVVVSVQDPDGACVNPGWNPDDVVCDTEGRLAEAWGVGDRLPAAFLWSWRGILLVRKGHIDEVERAVEEEMRRLPRVTLDDGMDRHLREMLRTELARTGKLDVVAGAEEERALAAIRKRSHEVQFSEWSACRLGERLAANSLLKATLVRAGSSRRLLVQLFSAETGCLHASAGVFWNKQRPELSLAEAVSELVNNLRVPVELPGGTAAPAVRERQAGELAEEWSLQEGASAVIIEFETEPPGAVVLLDGKVLCIRTPCSKPVTPGLHKLEFELQNYVPVSKTVSINERTEKTVKVRLTPNFGWLSVRSTPPGVSVMVDGKPWGTTPVEARQIAAGPHRVLVSDPRYFEKSREVVVGRGDHEEVAVKLSPREGGLRITARDHRDNSLRATVFVDGRQVGKTPFTGKLMVGQHWLRVVHGQATWERTITVREEEVERLEAVLDTGVAMAAERERSPSEYRGEPFQLGLSFAHGLPLMSKGRVRNGFSGTLSTWLKWEALRLEPVSVGVNFEGDHAVTVGTGACWEIVAGFYLRTLLHFAFVDDLQNVGGLTGVGYGLDLGGGWHLDAELDATFWHAESLAAPFDGRVGVRHGF